MEHCPVQCLVSIPKLGPLFSDYPMRSPYQILTLTREIAAVKVASGAIGALHRIPPNSRVRRIRASDKRDMVQIEWQGEIYMVFGQDLEERSETIDGDDASFARAPGG
jgi:hypothetical protein